MHQNEFGSSVPPGHTEGTNSTSRTLIGLSRGRRRKERNGEEEVEEKGGKGKEREGRVREKEV